MFDEIIIDANTCIRIGDSDKYKFLEILIPLISKKIFIH